MTFHIITLFPDAFDSYINESILKRAQEDKKIFIKFYNPRDFSDEKWARVDRKPYGGGPGMVIQALPVIKAIEKALGRKTTAQKKKVKIIWFTPQGVQFTNEYAKKAAEKYTDIVLICGRYEGIDARVKKVFRVDEISVGPFVLTGGELPAMLVVDTVARQVEGVLGNFDSLEESRLAAADVYTRPEVIEYKKKKYPAPKVLLSGDPKKINEWKLTIKRK